MKTTTEQYTELVLSTKDTIYRLAKSITGSCVEAEDIVQDIYEKVWRARDAVLNSRYPRAYLCRMTRNLAIDRLRRRRDSVEISDRVVEDGNRLAVIGDMAYEIEEIAEVLECESANVRVYLSRARKYVREELLKAINYGTA